LEKTRITRIEDGFDFLGQNPRKYKGKLLIKPTKNNVKAVLVKVKETIRKFMAKKTGDMIRTLNPIIRGWANYHRHIVAKETFKGVDNQIYHYLWNWAKRRHPDKGKRWIARKYWLSGSKAWTFFSEEKTPEGKRKVELIRASHTNIRRHVKVKSAANPFDPKDEDYFEKRKADKLRRRIGRAVAMRHEGATTKEGTDNRESRKGNSFVSA